MPERQLQSCTSESERMFGECRPLYKLERVLCGIRVYTMFVCNDLQVFLRLIVSHILERMNMPCNTKQKRDYVFELFEV